MPTTYYGSSGSQSGAGRLPSYYNDSGFNVTQNPPGQQSSSRSASSSYNKSQGTSSSESGDYYDPQASAWRSALYPQLQNRFAATNPAAATQIPFGYYSAVGGQNANFPGITPSPVWTPEQINQQVNLNRAQTQSETGTQIRQMQQRLAGTGIQSNSPLAQELAASIGGQGLAGQTAAENQLRFQAAQGNAANILKGQQLALDTATQQAADERARRAMGLTARAQDLETLTGTQNALLQAMGYYNRPLSRSRSQSAQSAQGGSSSYSGSTSGSSNDPLVQELPW